MSVPTTVVDTTAFMAQLRAALFDLYLAAQRWDLPDRYHIGIRAREVANHDRPDEGEFPEAR